MVKSLPMEAATDGEFKMLGIPVKFSRTKPGIHSPPPMLGQHTSEILAEIGRDAEMEQLYKEGVI